MAGRSSKSNSRGSRRIGTAIAGRVSLRTRVIWGAFTAAMTVVGGLLFVADRSPARALDGYVVPALMSTTGAPVSIDAIYETRQALDTQRWKGMVIHHSGAAAGTLESLEAEALRSGLKGVGYHFVIGNGRGIDDGEIVVTKRWMDQVPGAHVGGPNANHYNLQTVGICLIGDGDRRNFTEAQLRALDELVASLSRRLKISRESVLLHNQLAQTTDPGRLFPEAAFRESLRRR
jgi:hypothetical protein